jgi:DNA-binding CsgD family transcriptional regulator
MRRGRPRYPDLLTPREQEVLSLIREGLTNEQIAGRLGISESGARYHVSQILGKLGVESRVEAAQWREAQARRVFAALPLLGRLLGSVSGRLAAVVMVFGGAALLVLALGAAVTLYRGGLSEDPDSADRREPGPELEHFIALAEEATTEARTVMATAELFFIATGSEIFTFGFFEPGTTRVMTVTGPYVNDPAFPLWEHFPDQERDDGLPELEAIDLSVLQHRPEEVLEAVNARPPWRAEGAILQIDDGELFWTAYGGRTSSLQCHLPDSDLMQITCNFAAQNGPQSADTLIQLATEATREAQLTMADAVLFQVNYEALTGLYYFKFTESTPMHEMHVMGPYDDSGGSRWQVSVTDFSNLQGSQLSPLDVNGLEHGVAEVVAAAATEAGRPSSHPYLTLWNSFGSLQWAATFSGSLNCYAADSDHLVQFQCGPLVGPTPALSP